MARPRDPRADEAILGAVLDLLAEVGFGRFTMDDVAAAAGVGKATIYRRWPSKEQLVLEALASGREPPPPVDTGDLRADLTEIYERMVGPQARETTTRLMPALAVEAAVDEDVRVRLRAFVDDRRQPARDAFARAMARGEVGADLDVELTIDLITGSVLNRLFFSDLPVDEDVLAKVLDVVLAGIGVTTAVR
ncbi:MAG: TetR/AcrR family transcriptional regulator [Actinobacteria bacterium]|nr:TetR/AcrR family transcriptional regulator [Actinomycetota bacterium]